MIYPLKLRPFFRHGDQTPWGGQALAQCFHKPIPDARTGESLEISAIPGMESVIENGALAGQTLTDALSAWGDKLTGRADAAFPLLVKLLDAREKLSVQVHPGDNYAYLNEHGKLGKTEAWLILSCAPDARIVYGLNTKGRALSDCVKGGQLETSLNWMRVKPGDVCYIPSGLVHALGGSAGGDLVVYEIQQSSDVTYRFWDWGRVDAQGRARELHTQKALDVSDARLLPDKPAGVRVPVPGGEITYYIANQYFELSLVLVQDRLPLAGGRMRLLTALDPIDIAWEEGDIRLMPGDSAVVPAAFFGAALVRPAGGARVDGAQGDGARVVMTAMPDLAKLRAQLGARAGEVAGLEGERSVK
ncbi:MAG: type I phosphomannose isomerase catalytic subunit [Clostridia bacterium]